MARREYRFYVYIMGSLSGTLYIGMTNNLHKRVWQHKGHEIEGFTQRYNVDRLLYWESFDDVRVAINREKRLKGWLRRRKVALIESMNPGWCDLAKEWYGDRGPSLALAPAAPALAPAQDDRGKSGGSQPEKARTKQTDVLAEQGDKVSCGARGPSLAPAQDDRGKRSGLNRRAVCVSGTVAKKV